MDLIIFTELRQCTVPVWFCVEGIPGISTRFNLPMMDIEGKAETLGVKDDNSDRRGVLIQFVDDNVINPETIAHEALLAAIKIMKMVLNEDDLFIGENKWGRESLCYLVEQIVREIWQYRVQRMTQRI